MWDGLSTPQFMFTRRANQNATSSLFSFVCQEKNPKWNDLWNCFVVFHITVTQLSSLPPSCSSKQISEPDNRTVLFFPATNPSSKRIAESLHQPLVMAMKWTSACVRATVAYPSQHINVAPKNYYSTSWVSTANKTALKLIWLSYSCLLLEI